MVLVRRDVLVAMVAMMALVAKAGVLETRSTACVDSLTWVGTDARGMPATCASIKGALALDGERDDLCKGVTACPSSCDRACASPRRFRRRRRLAAKKNKIKKKQKKTEGTKSPTPYGMPTPRPTTSPTTSPTPYGMPTPSPTRARAVEYTL